MPVVDAQAAGGGVQSWYQALPPITRFCATACFLASLGSYVGLLSPRQIALLGPLVFKRFELWRLVTCHFFLGNFSMKFMFELLWLLQYGNILETNTFLHAPADMVFMLLLGAGLLTALSLGVPSLGLVFTASPLVFMLLYVYSRNFPTQNVSIMGLFQLQAFYLPFAFLGITIVMGGDPVPDILGIIIGHLWWFLTELYPAEHNGRSLLATPGWLKQTVANLGIGPLPAPTDSTPAGFAAFRGTGRRLGAAAPSGGRPHTD